MNNVCTGIIFFSYIIFEELIVMKKFVKDLKNEFSGYNLNKLLNDLMAGITVAAVALPLALAFGVSSGADAAAGLITAIVAGVVISIFSGASYQISGPTGAMTAVLVTIVMRYNIQGVFIASLMAGAILLTLGILKLGKLVNLIPMPVITGFTSGIAIIIALGQIDNFFGTHSQGESALQKLFSYTRLGFHINWQALVIGLLVVLIMVFYPKKLNAKLPSSLVAIIVAGLVSNLLHFDIAVVGNIPKTLFPENRLRFSDMIQVEMVIDLIAPAFTIAALGMIESLLCGASASRMKNEPFDADREMVAQGIGNIIIPFFGGVPATAAIARTSVAIKSGCQTRLTGIFHSIGLLASMFLLGSVMAKLPLAALAGVLMVTAYRMNEWESIKFFFKKKINGAMIEYLITMLATVVFDLTTAIIIGILCSLLMFIKHSAKISIKVSDIDPEKTGVVNEESRKKLDTTSLVTVKGPLFFATGEGIKKAFTTISNRAYSYEGGELVDCDRMIFIMSGVSTIDTTGASVLRDLCKELHDNNIEVCFTDTDEYVSKIMTKMGIFDIVGTEAVFANTEDALLNY